MRGTIQKSMIAATALLVIAGTTMALPNAANARWGGRVAEVGMAEAGMAAGVAVVGAGAVSASASEPGCSSPLLLVLPTTVGTATTTPIPMATRPHTAMALTATDIAAHTMATAAITRAIVTPGITPNVAITIGMVLTTPIVATPIADDR